MNGGSSHNYIPSMPTKEKLFNPSLCACSECRYTKVKDREREENSTTDRDEDERSAV